jgi:hypothetical protein
VDAVVLGNYRDFFAVIAGSAATLTGLLFVAMTVSESASQTRPPVIREFRVAAALVAFTNALAVSLFGLVPGTNVGYPAAILGVVGVFFTAAGVRTTLAHPALRHHRRPQLYLIVVLLLAFGFELAAGIVLLGTPHRVWALDTIGNVLVASLLIGIYRAWELVGDWNTGIVSSIAVLVGHKSMMSSASEGEAAHDPGAEIREDRPPDSRTDSAPDEMSGD